MALNADGLEIMEAPAATPAANADGLEIVAKPGQNADGLEIVQPVSKAGPTTATRQFFRPELTPEQQDQATTVRRAWQDAQARGETPQDMAERAQTVSDKWDAIISQARESRPENVAAFEAQRDQELREAGVEPMHMDMDVQLPRLSEGDTHVLFPGMGERAANAIRAGQGTVAGAAESFLTPEGAGMGAPKIGPAIAKAFMAQMAASVPEQLGQAAGHYSAGDVQSGDTALVNAGATAAMLGVPLLADRKPEPKAENEPPANDWLPKPPTPVPPVNADGLEIVKAPGGAATVEQNVPQDQNKGGESDAEQIIEAARLNGDVQHEGGTSNSEGALSAPESGTGIQARGPEETLSTPREEDISPIARMTLMQMIGNREPVPVSLLAQTATRPEALAEGYALNPAGTHYEFTEPARKLTPEQEMANANVQAMAELRAQIEANAQEGTEETETEKQTTPEAKPEEAEPIMRVAVSDKEIKDAMEATRGEATPDLLDVLRDHFPNGVKFDAEDQGEIVRNSRGAAAEQMFTAKGEAADRVLKALHEDGLYQRLQTPDDLALAMQAAGESRMAGRGMDAGAAVELARQQKRTKLFQDELANRASREGREPMRAAHLFVGDRFSLNGQPVRVVEQVTDAETRKPSHLEVEGAYGRQIIPADATVHLDKGSLKTGEPVIYPEHIDDGMTPFEKGPEYKAGLDKLLVAAEAGRSEGKEKQPPETEATKGTGEVSAAPKAARPRRKQSTGQTTEAPTDLAGKLLADANSVLPELRKLEKRNTSHIGQDNKPVESQGAHSTEDTASFKWAKEHNGKLAYTDEYRATLLRAVDAVRGKNPQADLQAIVDAHNHGQAMYDRQYGKMPAGHPGLTPFMWERRLHGSADAIATIADHLREENKGARVLKALDQLKFNFEQGKRVGSFGLLPLAWNTLIEGIKVAVRGGMALKDAIDAAITKLKASGADLKNFNEPAARAHLEETLGVRQFGQQLQRSTDISEALKGTVTNTIYERRPQETDQAYAARIVEDVGGPDKAIQVFRHETRLPQPVRMAVGMQILKRLDADGRTTDAANFFDHDLAPHTTDVAQGLAMLGAWHAMSKDGKLDWARLKILRAAKDATDPVRPDLEAAKTELEQQNARGIDQTAADPEVQNEAKAAVTEAVQNSDETHKGVVMELTEPWASSKYILDTARQHVAAKANELLNKAPRPPQFTPSQYLRSILDDLAKRAAGIAAGHYQGVEPGVILRDKLMQRLGLGKDAATRLAKALDEEFAKQVEAAKKALPKRVAHQAAAPARKAERAKAKAVTKAELEKRTRQARSIPDREAEAAAKRLMESATNAAGKPKPALQEFYNRLTASLRKMLPTGDANPAKKSDMQLIAEAFANPEHYDEVWRRLGVELRAKYGIEGMADISNTLGQLTPEALTETQLDRSIRRQLAESKIKLGQLVREHWTKVDATGRDLKAKLVADAGLRGEAAQRLGDAIQKRFEALTGQAKQAALGKLLRPLKQLGLSKPELVDRLVKLANGGAFDDAKYWNAVRERMALPEWTPELRQQLSDIADKLGRIPTDRVEDMQRAQTEFLNAIERAKGVSNLELGLAFYMQNILSGLTTHVRVAIHTSTQMLAATTAEIGRALADRRLQDIPLIYEALARGAGKALTQQKDIFKSGLVVGSKLQKAAPLSVLEQIKFGQPGGTTVKQGRAAKAVLENRAATLLNLWKYNARLITAQHMLYFKPAEEMKLALLAARQARTEGLTGRAAVDRARLMLGYGAAQVRAAEAQALREGMAGTRAKMRVSEILQSQLPVEMKETARDYALRQTFLNEPYGFAGQVANLVASARQSPHAGLATAARVIVPFTRIAANLFNEGLNYTPAGAARAKFAKTELLGQKFADITPEVRSDLQRELYAKAALGSMLLLGVALKAAQGLNQANPGFTVYGAGPSNPQDKAAWRAAGGIPYSVKVGNRLVSYANTPSNVMFAALGNYLDGLRDAALYQRPGAERLAEDLPMRATAASIGASKVVLEQPFLQSLLELAQISGENNPEISARSGLKAVARTASSFVVPNLLRQADRFFDPTLYDQHALGGIVTSQVPFVRQTGRPVLNALGQPIQSPVFGMFTSERTTDPLVQTLAEHNAWPSLPERNRTTVNGVPLSDDEFYAFSKARGEALAQMLGKPAVQATLNELADEREQLTTQAATTANPVAKAKFLKTAGEMQSRVMEKFEAAADKAAEAAVVRTRGY